MELNNEFDDKTKKPLIIHYDYSDIEYVKHYNYCENNNYVENEILPNNNNDDSNSKYCSMSHNNYEKFQPYATINKNIHNSCNSSISLANIPENEDSDNDLSDSQSITDDYKFSNFKFSDSLMNLEENVPSSDISSAVNSLPNDIMIYENNEVDTKENFPSFNDKLNSKVDKKQNEEIINVINAEKELLLVDDLDKKENLNEQLDQVGDKLLNQTKGKASKKDKNVDKNLSFSFIRGSDPRIATCRGKLQNKRSKLNQEINKELRLRAGAENLFKATTNRKLRETVALELSFVNSNLQLLKEQLAELNSSVELYQGESKEPVMPMIPLGLKETKEIDFTEPFKDFILEHYSEDGNNYADAITQFMNIRQAMRTPHRDNSGISLLFQYYNQLYFVERRFFPPDRSLGIYFEWYDSLTGVPSCQRTVAFEKACVLFNMAAVYTQMGAKQDRLTSKGLDQAVDSFLRAAGTFTYIQENFTNAPSMDLAPHMMDMLVQLMLAQARECLFVKLELQSRDKRDIDISLDLAQEAAQVADIYSTVSNLISVPTVRDYVPYSWVALLQVKREHYAAVAHYHGALALLSTSMQQLSQQTMRMLHLVHSRQISDSFSNPITEEQCKLLGQAHLRSALLFHEEAQRIQRMSRELRNKNFLTQVLNKSHERTSKLYFNTDVEDDFSEVLDPPDIEPSSKFQLSLTPPDFAYLSVEDMFQGLGPVAIFSAKHHWSAPRSIQLKRVNNGDSGFGFSVRGDSPVIIAAVDVGSLAQIGGVKEGDFIVSISNKDVKWAQHDEVVKLIKEAGDCLNLKLVTPMDRNYLKPREKLANSIGTDESNALINKNGSSQHSPSNSVTTHKRLSWNLFRKQREKETNFNQIFR